MVAETLRQLNTWIDEPTQELDRPKLLSKLAVLELCGWIEAEFDRLALLVESGRLDDADWVHAKIISRTHGFHYDKHWRDMLTMLVGEVFARRVERRMEENHPGDLDRLKSLLGTLWRMRCDFAHADLTVNITVMQTFHAPSWTIDQHRTLVNLLDHYQQEMLAVLDEISTRSHVA